MINPSNITSGFKRTGIYPLDREKFPIEGLDARLLWRYTKWVEMGKPSDIFEGAFQSVETPKKLKPTPEERNDMQLRILFNYKNSLLILHQ